MRETVTRGRSSLWLLLAPLLLSAGAAVAAEPIPLNALERSLSCYWSSRDDDLQFDLILHGDRTYEARVTKFGIQRHGVEQHSASGRWGVSGPVLFLSESDSDASPRTVRYQLESPYLLHVSDVDGFGPSRRYVRAEPTDGRYRPALTSAECALAGWWSYEEPDRVFDLDLHVDHTYHVLVFKQGGPRRFQGGGTWACSGTVLSLTPASPLNATPPPTRTDDMHYQFDEQARLQLSDPDCFGPALTYERKGGRRYDRSMRPWDDPRGRTASRQ